MSEPITKHQEIRKTTAAPSEMQGMYIAETVKRGWVEDFVDEDTAEIVQIERNEVIIEKGTYINGDILAQIKFHMDAGDINTVEVSNQKRAAQVIGLKNFSVWYSVIQMGKRKVKLLFYAQSLEMSNEIIKDFIELNYSGFFIITQLKEFGNYILINRDIHPEDEDPETEDLKYYKIEITIGTAESVYPQHFVVYARNVDAAVILIENWIAKNSEHDKEDFTTVLESANAMACDHIISKEFSKAYAEKVD